MRPTATGSIMGRGGSNDGSSKPGVPIATSGISGSSAAALVMTGTTLRSGGLGLDRSTVEPIGSRDLYFVHRDDPIDDVVVGVLSDDRFPFEAE